MLRKIISGGQTGADRDPEKRAASGRDGEASRMEEGRVGDWQPKFLVSGYFRLEPVG
jgi:hypothetical protein